MNYYFNKTLSEVSFNEAIEKVTAELKKEGFGVLARIDMHHTLKEKIGVDFRNYTILEACNPPFAHKSLLAEDKIGIMLPCNIVVQDAGDGKVEVAVVNPVSAMQAVNNPDMNDIAQEIQGKLKKVLSQV
jgi:uncharacterized protein (DUF302 family)